jgi:hypothetical protein
MHNPKSPISNGALEIGFNQAAVVGAVGMAAVLEATTGKTTGLLLLAREVDQWLWP